MRNWVFQAHRIGILKSGGSRFCWFGLKDRRISEVGFWTRLELVKWVFIRLVFLERERESLWAHSSNVKERGEFWSTESSKVLLFIRRLIVRIFSFIFSSL